MKGTDVIRPILPTEYKIVGDLCVEAYVQAGIVKPNDAYVETLRDTERRATTDTAEVLVLTQGDKIAGTITMAPFGSDLTIVCRPGEVEPRVLAVAPDRERTGIGRQLVDYSEEWARRHELHTVVVCVADGNTRAFAMYEQAGFIADEDRDWVEPGGVLLRTLTKDVSALDQIFCARCGFELGTGGHDSCQEALALEPPRYCTVCKRRMIVQVTPTGWSARCKEHGIQNS